MAEASIIPYIPESILQLVTDGIKLDYKLDIDGVTLYSATGKHLVKSITSFSDPALGLSEQLRKNLKSANHDTPTAIQRHGMPQIMADSDMMCCSHTGSGKTATYLVPLLNSLVAGGRRTGSVESRVSNGIQSVESESGGVPKSKHFGQSAPAILILVPTRELAEQVNEMAKVLGQGLPLKSLAVYGGDSLGSELGQLRRRNINLLVATPGRLIHILTDFVDVLTLSSVKYFVIDEADEMFNRGFFPQITEIMSPNHMGPIEGRENIMFSATFPRQIQYYAQKYLRSNFSFVAVGVVGGASPAIIQDIRSADGVEKGGVLGDILLTKNKNKILVFCNSIEGVDALTNNLLGQGNLTCASIHSLHSQPERDQALMDFNNGKIRCLIATSVAARGLNIKDVHCVVNYDIPRDICEYVQRIGRARTIGEGLPAVAISLFDREKDVDILADLIFILDDAKQDIPVFLFNLQQGLQERKAELVRENPYSDDDAICKLQKMRFTECVDSGFDQDSWG